MALSKSNHIIIGMGQIGTAVFNVLLGNYSVNGFDVKDQKDTNFSEPVNAYDVMHVAFPYSENFVKEVVKYRNYWLKEDGLIIVHSTVPVGTCEKIPAVHSPVRGIHPNLMEGIMTFEKLFSGQRAKEAAKYFAKVGVKTKVTENSRDSEAMKLWDTTIYGMNIRLEKKIHRFCEENGLDFDTVYTWSAKTYNDGYEKLGHPEYKKYVLKHVPGKIGGHCVLPNLELLGDKEVKKFVLGD